MSSGGSGSGSDAYEPLPVFGRAFFCGGSLVGTLRGGDVREGVM